MSQTDLQQELEHSAPEPLLPVEKKLIGWSLGIGVALLIALILLNRYVPLTL